jgi:hypothetical protein
MMDYGRGMLCDGLLNSHDFQYLSTLLSKLPDSSKLVVSALDKVYRSWFVSRAIIGHINGFVIVSFLEKIDFIISHVDDAYISDFVEKHNAIIDSASFATELNTLTRDDYEKSKRPDKGDDPW